MLSYVIALFVSCMAYPVFAENGHNLVESLIENSQHKMGEYLEEAQMLDQAARSKIENILKSEPGTDQNRDCGCQKQPSFSFESNSTNVLLKVLIFISFSMPKESLRNLFVEAEQQGAALILRGLKNNSFVETAELMQELAIAAQIDPQLFDKYQINAVPTFVSITESEPLWLKGNVSLSYAQDAFKKIMKAIQ